MSCRLNLYASSSPVPAIPRDQFNPVERRYFENSHGHTPQYGTYPPFSPTPGHDASLSNHDLSLPLQVEAPCSEGILEIPSHITDHALFASSSAATSPSVATSISPSPLDTRSTATDTDQEGNLCQSKVTNKVEGADEGAITGGPYQPTFAASCGLLQIATFASLSSMSEEQGVFAKCIIQVPTFGAPVQYRSIQPKRTPDISAFLSREPELESVFIPDVDSDGNRVSGVLDQVVEFIDGSLLVARMNSEPHNFDLNTTSFIDFSSSEEFQCNSSHSFISNPPLNSFWDGSSDLRVLSESLLSLDFVSVSLDDSPWASKDSLALVTSIIIRLAFEWDDDDPAYDPRLRFKEDSESGDFGDEATSLIFHSDQESKHGHIAHLAG